MKVIKKFQIANQKVFENYLKNAEPLVDIKIKKGEKTNISWGCLSALIEAKISSTYSRILLNEENLVLNEDVLEDEEFIEGECFEI